MDTFQILKLLTKDKYAKKHFCGVLPIDKLPITKIRRPCSFIINTDNSNFPGQHWFALYVPRIGKVEYFDSYGLKPINPQIYEFLRANGSKYIYNSKRIQSDLSKNCGKFCIFYIYMRSRNFPMKQITQFFVSNKNINDLLINKIFKKYI
jgi:hypothetical protein